MVVSFRLNRGLTFFLKCHHYNETFCSFSSAIVKLSSLDNGHSVFDNHKTLQSSNNEIVKRMPLTIEEFKSIRKEKPLQPDNPHLLRVAMLGEPNAGKSTLTNSLVKWRVCSVSRKVHTTRKMASAVLNEDNKQIVFIDLPGYVSPEVTKKHHLEPSFVMDPIKSINIADIIAVVVDIANKYTNNRIHEKILETLETHKDRKSILILNKVDAMKSKDRLLSLTRILTGGVTSGEKTSELPKPSIEKRFYSHIYNELGENIEIGHELSSERQPRGWTSFSKIFMVSGLNHDGVEELRDYFLSETKPHKWAFSNDVVTDQTPHEIALTTVREKLLEYLPEEIPYLLVLKIAKWEILSSGCPKIDISIKCPNSRHKRFVIGPAGKHIAACVERSRRSLREAFRTDVVLHIGVI